MPPDTTTEMSRIITISIHGTEEFPRPKLSSLYMKHLNIRSCQHILWLMFGIILFSACQSGTAPADDETIEDYITVSYGGRLYYQEQGQGEAVFLFHGHSLDHRMWAAQIPALSDKYRVIVPDFRGYGRSSQQDEQQQYTHVDDIIALMDSLGIDRAHFVGLSMGSFVAGDMVAMYPERMLSCVLASGGIRSTPGPHTPMDSVESARRDDEIAALQAQGIDDYKRQWIEALISSGGTNREQMRPALTQMITDWSAWQPLHKEVRLFYAREAWDSLRVRRPQVPTLILNGANDYNGKPSTMLDYLPNGQHKVLPNCGHMMNMDQPDAFNRELLHFLAANPRSPHRQ